MCCGELQQFQLDRQYDAPLSARDRTLFDKDGSAHWTHDTATSVICGAHFVTLDDFEGYHQCSMVYKRQLDLKKGAIPSKMSYRKDPETPMACKCNPTVATATSTATANSTATLSAASASGDRSKKRTRTDSAVRKLSVARVCKTFLSFCHVVVAELLPRHNVITNYFHQ